MTLFHSSFSPDLSKPTCRVCLQNQQGGQMFSIYDLDTDIDDLHIYEKIEQCAGIKVLSHIKMPTLICGDCYGLLQVSFKFRSICQSSNDYLNKFIVCAESNTKLEEPSSEENPLLLTNNISTQDETCSQYKRRLRTRLSLLSQTIKHEEESRSNSPAISENGDGLDDDTGADDGEVLFNIDYNDDDEDEISCGENIESSEEEFVVKKKSKSKKTKNLPKRNKKKCSAALSKTLEISPDGAAIIREKKPRDRKVKKGKKDKREKQPHICDVCGNIYHRRYALEAHIKRHGDKKPYECEICGYAFYANFELIRHMRKHTGSRPYKCSFCTRAFGDQSTLIKHERIHRNERPFKCETCGKSFTYSNVLKYHILTHTGEKPYSCEICGKCFNSPHHLRAHLRTLQHQNDPRTVMLIKNIRKNNETELLKVDSFSPSDIAIASKLN